MLCDLLSKDNSAYELLIDFLAFNLLILLKYLKLLKFRKIHITAVA